MSLFKKLPTPGLKERCSQLYSSNIVYNKFTCPKTKDISYIGESKRQFFKRFEEHNIMTTIVLYIIISRIVMDVKIVGT